MSERTRVVHVDDNAPGAVDIGRAVLGRGLRKSICATPYRADIDGDRATVIARYRQQLRVRMRVGRATLTQGLRELVGKPLACWYRHDGEAPTLDTACHGDVLIEMIRELGLERQDNFAAR